MPQEPIYGQRRGLHPMRNMTNTYSRYQKIVPSDNVASGAFGQAVSMSDTNLAVGRPSSSNAVFMFAYNGSSWNQAQILSGTASTSFGKSVSLDGTTLAVGAPGESSNAGATYIYYLASGTWSQTKKLVVTLSGGDNFGHSVTLSSFYVVVGAWGDDTKGGNAGAAYVFGRNTGGTDNWGLMKKVRWRAHIDIGASSRDRFVQFTGSTTQGGDNFGMSVTLYRGYFVIVGAPGKAANVGAAYLYYRNQGGTDNFGETAIVGSASSNNNHYFATYVTLNDDNVVIGAIGMGTGGQVLIYPRTFCCASGLADTNELR